jgi:cytochrome c oxidase subunit 5a
MSSSNFLRFAARAGRASTFQACRRAATPVPRRLTPAVASTATQSFSTTAIRASGDPHGEETFEEFTARYDRSFWMMETSQWLWHGQNPP